MLSVIIFLRHVVYIFIDNRRHRSWRVYSTVMVINLNFGRLFGFDLVPLYQHQHAQKMNHSELLLGCIVIKTHID
jgi:hypothetical protein